MAVHTVCVTYKLDAQRLRSQIMVDSGAGASVFSDGDMFLSLHAPDCYTSVCFGNQKTVAVSAVGTIAFYVRSHESKAPVRIVLHDVLYVPDAGSGLHIVSVHTLRLHQHGANFDAPEPYVRWHNTAGDVYQSCVWTGNVPYVPVMFQYTGGSTRSCALAAICAHVSVPPTDLDVQHAHARFGHVGNSKLDALAKLEVIPKATAQKYREQPCSDCQLANATRDPYPPVDGQGRLPGDVLHADLLHFPEPTLDGKKYALISVDEYTRFVEAALLAKKSDSAAHIVRIMKRFHTLHNRSVKYLRTDLGGEFRSTALQVAKTELGISDQHIPARCHESNGLVERVNRTLAEMVRAVLKTSKLPLSFWGEALLYAVHTYNLLPHRSLIDRGCAMPIPHALFHSESPERLARLHAQLLPFGISCFIHTVDDHPKKLADRAYPGFILGYGPSSYLYRVVVVDSVTGSLKFRIVRHLSVTVSCHTEYHSREHAPFHLRKPARLCHVQTCADPLLTAATWSVHALEEVTIPPEPQLASHLYPAHVAPAGVSVVSVSTALPRSPSAVDLTRDRERVGHRRNGRRHERSRCDPAELMLDVVNSGTIDCQMVTASCAGTVLHHCLPSAPRSSECRQKAMSLWLEPQVPVFLIEDFGQCSVLKISADSPSVKTALSGHDSEEWMLSLQDELASITSNGVYELVDRPPGVNIVGSKWVLKYKRNAFGEIERRKSRLVAQGFSQKPGVDFNELYSPTPQQATFRMILLFAARFDLNIRQVDIKCAFLQGDLEETIYMHQPPLFNDGTARVWKLRKPIYGLKQAPRQWNHKLTAALEDMSFRQADHDAALFVHTEHTALIFVWVDDLIIIADSDHTETLVKAILGRFEGRDLGDASWILGLEILRDRPNRVVTMTQRRMILDILDRFDIPTTPVGTPLDPGQPIAAHPHSKAIERYGVKLEQADLPIEEREALEAKIATLLKDGALLGDEEKSRYMQIVGAVQYLATVSRPDIAYATGALARYMAKPTKYLLKCAERLLRYLRGTSEYGLVLNGAKDSSQPDIMAYADSDFQRSTYSTTGMVLCLFGQPVHWRSKRQNILATSSTEAEIMAMNMTSITLKWFKMLAMGDLSIPAKSTVLYGDNQSAVTVCKDPQSSDRTRHIDGKHKKIQEFIKNNVLTLQWIPTAEMLADCLTKQLPKPAFEDFRSKLGVLKPPGLKSLHRSDEA